ncbi:MAG: HAD family hydrolase [Acholeplasmataceae bacterium]|nr:MAG: HAD family hydrolase [Acholeplasmataceae bacterium]
MRTGIIFDMDGTILNTIDDIQASVNHALAAKDLPLRTLEQVKADVGRSASYLIRQSVPAHLKADDITEVFNLYQHHYDQNNMNRTGPYEGIIGLLKRLKAKGCKLAVVSNKVEYLVHELNQNIFHGLFDLSIGVRDGIPIKPAPDMLLAALEKLGLEPQDTIFIGDSDIDIETAQNAGLESIGVTWGFRTEASLKAQNADHIVHDVKALETLLERI